MFCGLLMWQFDTTLPAARFTAGTVFLGSWGWSLVSSRHGVLRPNAAAMVQHSKFYLSKIISKIHNVTRTTGSFLWAQDSDIHACMHACTHLAHVVCTGVFYVVKLCSQWICGRVASVILVHVFMKLASDEMMVSSSELMDSSLYVHLQNPDLAHDWLACLSGLHIFKKKWNAATLLTPNQTSLIAHIKKQKHENVRNHFVFLTVCVIRAQGALTLCVPRVSLPHVWGPPWLHLRPHGS